MAVSSCKLRQLSVLDRRHPILADHQEHRPIPLLARGERRLDRRQRSFGGIAHPWETNTGLLWRRGFDVSRRRRAPARGR